jgi:predicted small lipoprotein YifL
MAASLCSLLIYNPLKISITASQFGGPLELPPSTYPNSSATVSMINAFLSSSIPSIFIKFFSRYPLIAYEIFGSNSLISGIIDISGIPPEFPPWFPPLLSPLLPNTSL